MMKHGGHVLAQQQFEHGSHILEDKHGPRIWTLRGAFNEH